MKKLQLITLLLFCSLPLSGQISDIVKTQGIISPTHQANLGKIAFAAKPIPIEAYKETDFLKAHELSNTSTLYMTAFMDNSITNYLHRLAPELTAEELYGKGNLQFTFYVDGHLVYQENLHYGAGLPPVKNTNTVLSRPLVSYPNMVGWWSEYMWNRFLNNGGEKALTEGKHLFKIELRPYIKNPELKVGDLIAAGQIELNRKLPKIDIATVQLQEVKPYNGLSVSKERYDINKIKELKANINEGVFRSISSIAVIKNGKILIEEYFNGASRNTLHDPRSVGKSFASTVTGIAIGEGYLKNENQQLKEFYNLKDFANYSTQKDNTLIKDLLTMSSVFEGNDNNDSSAGNEENMYPTDNWVKFALDLPVDNVRPTGEWHYFTAGVVLLGGILHKTVPEGLEKYADKKLFKPLGITQYEWQYTPQKVANTAGGIRMSTLDFAKYGLLYKNGGKWNNQQIIPEAWVNKTFSKQKAIPQREDEFYGYLFWNKKYQVKGKNYETNYCTGNGGNKIFIFKDQPLVIVVTATAYGAPYGHSQVDKMMTDYILPAVIGVK